MSTETSRFADRLRLASEDASSRLLAERNAHGHWEGRLSDSALAAATAISALSQYREHCTQPVIPVERTGELIDKGVQWLLRQQNPDGGWGDTDQSHSNVATSMLVVAALTLAGKSGEPETDRAVARANEWIDKRGRVQALRRRYGKDKTFAVPILANCAIAGLVPWKEVSALPFEAVLLPQSFYRFVSLPVVSYAIPALVGIGQAKFIKDPPWNPVTRLIRQASLNKGLRTLLKMQPESGGFLEAIPLTCFVAMSLAHTGRADHEVVHQGIRFVDQSFRDLGDSGTWPIDTNLATWNTTLSINALQQRVDQSHLSDALLDWVLDCQYTDTHPFTGAAPGGWGWSDLPGAVPDADDTPGALLALRAWFDKDTCTAEQASRIKVAATAGVHWLLDLQNRDGGWPTFCRGWGRLPFDRSGNDITAHVIRALHAWRHCGSEPRIDRAIERGFDFLAKYRQSAGPWLPLWFGNQDDAREENPVYGTVKVLLAYLETGRINDIHAKKAIHWLCENQNQDFGWGGGPSCEQGPAKRSGEFASSLQETALAVEVLARIRLANSPESSITDTNLDQVLLSGLEWLVRAVEHGNLDESWPIGFYFAKLWYYERLYPLVFSVSALGFAEQALQQKAATDPARSPAALPEQSH